MHNPVEFVVGTRNEGAANVKHIYYMVKANDKYLALKRIADNNPNIYGIVFVVLVVIHKKLPIISLPTAIMPIRCMVICLNNSATW